MRSSENLTYTGAPQLRLHRTMPRIFAISDVHVDYPENMRRVMEISTSDYQEDCLVLAGDVSDSLEQLEYLFNALLSRFRQLVFVPGNHELWVRTGKHSHSLEKFLSVQTLCEKLGVRDVPLRVGTADSAVWLVPLYSWYRYPEDCGRSLHIRKEGESWRAGLWMDESLCKWPAELNSTRRISDHFLDLNRARVNGHYDAPVISLSHFLPRKELMFDTTGHARRFCQPGQTIPAHPQDPLPMFNFTRVAGCELLDTQIRQLSAVAHIYGHQHRNRCRKIEGVTYISHCLGYAREQHILGTSAEPKLIWDQGCLIEAEDTM